MLEKTDELAKHRLKVAEMMLTQISEEMRQQRRIKEQTFKRVSGGGGEGRGGREGGGGGRRMMNAYHNPFISLFSVL